MTTIKINTTPDWWPYEEWKEYIYPPEEFDEVFAVFGNSDYKGVTNASWYKAVVAYQEENDVDFMSALKILFPNKRFEHVPIRGSVQREWQDVVYDATSVCDFDAESFADFYFGYVTEIRTDDLVEYVSDSVFWEHEHDGDLKKFLCDLMWVEDEDVVIYKDGEVIFGQEFLDEAERKWNRMLWDTLRSHLGHRVEIAVYGDVDNPASVTLEDIDTGSVILDAGIYTLKPRED